MARTLASKSRVITVLMRKAQRGLLEGDEMLVRDCLDRVNALLFYRVVHVHVEDSQIVANVSGDVRRNRSVRKSSDDIVLPQGLMFIATRVVEYFKDGRIRVVKDRERQAPYWVVEHPTYEGVQP